MPSIIRSRLGLLSAVSLASLSGILMVACESSSTSTPDGARDGGPSTGDASACSAEGIGSISVVVSGLPEGVAAKVTVSGETGEPVVASASTTLADKPAGDYSVTATRVAKADPIVRTLYEPTVSTASFCLEGTQTQTVTVTYAEIASSHKLWSTNGNNDSGQLIAFAGADLGATNAVAAKVAMKGVVGAGPGNAVAFDKDGNLWSLGGTTTDAPLLRFKAADLGVSGDKTPDRKISPEGTGCGPALSSLAFDPSGALWVTNLCEDKILRLSPETLGASKEYTPAAEDVATGVEAPRRVAFDKTGNMWVSGDGTLHRFSAASLAVGQPHLPDFMITAKAENDAELPPDALAFDAEGNLWVTSFGGNAIYKLTPAQLTPNGAAQTLVPPTVITIGVGALIYDIAFDESGGLWVTLGGGKVGRLAPAQLGTSTGPGAPTVPETVVSSTDLGASNALAFFPAPATLPLYSRLDSE